MALRYLKVFSLILMIDAIPNIVIINNKPMTYDSRGELVDYIEVSSDSSQIHEKSNFFKKSDFVTKSKFTHNGILTKHNFTKNEHPQNSKFSYDLNDFPYQSYINNLFNKEPDYIQTAVVFDDQPSVFNSSFANPFEKFERPTVAFYSTTTPAPTSIIPIIVTTQQPTSNKKKKPNNKKTKTKTPATSEIHEHIMKNLEYYRKLLNVNCSSKNEESETIEITPRPINDKDIQSLEKDKSKKKCDCKHHHHHHGSSHNHHKHSHEHHKESHEHHKPSSAASTIHPVYVHSQKVPDYQTHFHHHQSSQKGHNDGIFEATPLFESTGKLPPLGADYDEVGSVFDTFYRAIEGMFSTNSKDGNDVDYESRDESGSDYSESIEEVEEDVSESDYEEDDDRRRRRKREVKQENYAEDKLNILGKFYSLFKVFSSYFRGKSEESHNYSRKHLEGRVSGKVELLSRRLKREITPQLASSRVLNFSHVNGSNLDAITSRSIPGDFYEMITHMFSSTTTKRDAPITLQSSSGAIRKRYHNFQLWRIKTSKRSDISYLNELRMSREGKKLHWLESPRLFSFTDVVIAPEHLESFKNFLTKGNINYNVKLRNIQNAIRFENLRRNRKEQLEAEIINGHPLTFYRYHPSKDILSYYDYIKRKYPSFVELITLGFTFNSKPLVVVKISAPKKVKRPGIFILAGVSANLWLPVASALHILDNIVTNLANNDSLGEYIRKYDWYVLSLMNVDGYDYSMAFDRLWRKTRSEYISDDSSGLISTPFSWFQKAAENESNCSGVDATRNFDVKWKRDDFTAGDDKCWEFYAGPNAKSEPEVRLLSSFLQKNNKHIKLFLNLDGYGSLISFPTSNLKRKSMEDIQEIAKAGLRNLKTHRSGEKKYMIKRDALLSSPEGFAMHKAKIKYSYRIDSIDNPKTSFFVPATYIQYNANDIFDVIKGMTKKLIKV